MTAALPPKLCLVPALIRAGQLLMKRFGGAILTAGRVAAGADRATTERRSTG